jgi:MMP 1-O-methyltransferase
VILKSQMPSTKLQINLKSQYPTSIINSNGVAMGVDGNLIRRVKGFLAEDEGRCLYKTAVAASRLGPCLEIGSYCGKSTLYLGAACKANNAILFSIDHHRGSEEQQPGEEYFDPDLYDPQAGRMDSFKEFRKSIEEADLEDTVVPIVSCSLVAARQWATPLSLVFIDGGHAFGTVFSDYTAWAGHIMGGGFLLIHDIFPDPAKGGQAPLHVYDLARHSGLFQEVSLVNTLGVLKRLKGGELPQSMVGIR